MNELCNQKRARATLTTIKQLIKWENYEFMLFDQLEAKSSIHSRIIL